MCLNMRPLNVLPAFVLALGLMTNIAADDELRQRLEDENGARTDVWTYNDITAAKAEARRTGKPIFVTFRCVPCTACRAFDAEVANGNEKVREFANEKFVAVRQVEMKGVDLTQFQFDHDLNWAAMFINADGTVYARYGTQSTDGPDAFNSIEGLVATMERVLALHDNYPRNRAELAGKRPSRQKPFTAFDMPGIRNPEKLAETTTRQNCIHCHMIHDYQNIEAMENGTLNNDMLFRYPLPDQLGLKIDNHSGVRITEVVAGSPAATAGIRAGETVTHMNGQAITSIADMQWVLHNIPNQDGESATVTTSESGEHALALSRGWKEYDISWRGSMWSVAPRLRAWTPELTADKKKEIGLDEDDSALEIRWINRQETGGKAVFAAGVREGDVLVEVDGKPLGSLPMQFHAWLKLNHKVGDRLPVVVMRNGERKQFTIDLVE